MEQEDFIIIWEWNLWTYVKLQLDENNYSSEIFAAKKFHLEEDYKNQIDEILLVQTLENLINWKKILFTWRKGELFDKILEKIEKLDEQYKQNFFVFWVNWIEKYWDLPQLTLNAKITQEWAKPFDKSYLYHSEPEKINLDFLQKLNLDIQVVSDKDEYLEYFFNKTLLNAIINSASILFFQNIWSSYNALTESIWWGIAFENKNKISEIKNILTNNVWKVITEQIVPWFMKWFWQLMIENKIHPFESWDILISIDNFVSKNMWEILTNSHIENIINNLNNDLSKYQADKISDWLINDFNLYLKKEWINIIINKNDFFEYFENAISIIWSDFPSSFYQHWWIEKDWMSFSLNLDKANSDIEEIINKISWVLDKNSIFSIILSWLKETKNLSPTIIMQMYNNYLRKKTDSKIILKNIEEFYNWISNKYNETFSEPSEYIDDFIEKLQLNGQILDIGCWNWTDSKYLYEKWFNVTWIDISDEFIKKNKQEEPWINYMLSNIINDDLWTNYFNWIISSFSLIHIEKENISKIVKKINKSLKKDWVFYISLQKSLMWNEKEVISPLGQDNKIFINSYWYVEIANILEQNWFEILEKYERWPKENELDFNKLFIIAKKSKIMKEMELINNIWDKPQILWLWIEPNISSQILDKLKEKSQDWKIAIIQEDLSELDLYLFKIVNLYYNFVDCENIEVYRLLYELYWEDIVYNRCDFHINWKDEFINFFEERFNNLKIQHNIEEIIPFKNKVYVKWTFSWKNLRINQDISWEFVDIHTFSEEKDITKRKIIDRRTFLSNETLENFFDNFQINLIKESDIIETEVLEKNENSILFKINCSSGNKTLNYMKNKFIKMWYWIEHITWWNWDMTQIIMFYDLKKWWDIKYYDSSIWSELIK